MLAWRAAVADFVIARGEIAAERLAQMGARIVLIARDKSRGEATLARLHERASGLGHAVHYADLARIPEMKRVAAEIAHKEPRIDVLINNVGAMFSSRRLTEDGLEYTFALNHMAYFVVTEGLRERLLARGYMFSRLALVRAAFYRNV